MLLLLLLLYVSEIHSSEGVMVVNVTTIVVYVCECVCVGTEPSHIQAFFTDVIWLEVEIVLVVVVKVMK